MKEMASGNDQLVAFLESTLAQLDMISGAPDPDAHAQLEQLKQVLSAGSTPAQQGGAKGAPVVNMSEEQMEAFLNSLDEQMTALEANLASMGPDAAQLLADGLTAWQGSSAGAAGAQPAQPALEAVGEEEAEETEGSKAESEARQKGEDVLGVQVDQTAVAVEALTLQASEEKPAT